MVHTFMLFLFMSLSAIEFGNTSDGVTLYYYGLEESERGLPACERQQACSVLVERYWRAVAMLRLCRCPRRARCSLYTLLLNNRAHFKFCEPTTNWRTCDMNETALSLESSYDNINPDELETLHHSEIDLTPPRIQFTCRCPEPNYWRLASRNQTHLMYKCHLMSPCGEDQFCGNVTYELNALYQHCTCPPKHICVHNGGIHRVNITELLHTGSGRRAYCQQLQLSDTIYEDY